MAASSKKYPKITRDVISSETGASVSSTSKISGSALTLVSLDKYFLDSVDMLTDGFLNPDWTKDVLESLYKECEQ